MHRILKSDLKLSEASARWVPRLLSVDDCEHNPASYNCILSDVINTSWKFLRMKMTPSNLYLYIVKMRFEKVK